MRKNQNEISGKQSCKIFGNNIDRIVHLGEECGDFSDYAGKPVRLRFRMRDAKLFSMIFE